MIRTGNRYLDSIRDGREVYINGGRVEDVTQHSMMKPLIDIRARIYDMQHEASSRELLAYREDGEWNVIANKLPRVHVSANTDPKGDRSKPPQEQDPDMLLHVVKETDAGIIVRGAKYETAAPYANQALGRAPSYGVPGDL